MALAGVLASAAITAGIVVHGAGMLFEAAGFVRFVALAGAMLALAGWCAIRFPDKRLAHAAAIVSVGTISLMLCGIVSNAGLRWGTPLVDPSLAAIDAMFGVKVDEVVRFMSRAPTLISFLAAVYNASGAAVVALIAIAVVGRSATRAWELTVTAVLSMQVVAILSILMPAIGAMSYLNMGDLQGAGLPAGAGVYHLDAFEHFRNGSDPHLRLADMSGLVTFPSFHTILGLLGCQALWDTRLRWCGAGWAAAVVVSTVPIGGHYVTDLAAGFVIWLAAATLARRVNNPSI